jgi:ribonucleotide reductase beta subunit family protein with ferritin-like domain
MEENKEHKKELKDKLIFFFKSNKLKIYLFFGLLFIIISVFTFSSINNHKKNNIIAEKYINAGLNLTAKNIKKAEVLYEEIILSKNNFYSLLALNTALEKNLFTDSNKVLKFFEIVEKLDNSSEQQDLIIFKKALYLIKIGNKEEGNKLLRVIIKKNSKLKTLAENIISE